MMKTSGGGIAGERLRSLIERVERLHEERKAIGKDISEVFGEAKLAGFDPKVMKMVIKDRALEPADRAERDTVYAVYWDALHLNESKLDNSKNLDHARVRAPAREANSETESPDPSSDGEKGAASPETQVVPPTPEDSAPPPTGQQDSEPAESGDADGTPGDAAEEQIAGSDQPEGPSEPPTLKDDPVDCVAATDSRETQDDDGPMQAVARRGAQAFRAGIPLTLNPFLAKGGETAKAWNDGWIAEQAAHTEHDPETGEIIDMEGAGDAEETEVQDEHPEVQSAGSREPVLQQAQPHVAAGEGTSVRPGDDGRDTQAPIGAAANPCGALPATVGGHGNGTGDPLDAEDWPDVPDFLDRRSASV